MAGIPKKPAEPRHDLLADLRQVFPGLDIEVPHRTGKGGGRSKAEVDLRFVAYVAQRGGTMDEIGQAYGVSAQALGQREDIQTVWKRNLELFRMSIRTVLFDKMLEPGNTGLQAAIHLAKHYLGQNDYALDIANRSNKRPGLGPEDARTDLADAFRQISDRLQGPLAGREGGAAAEAGAEPVPGKAVH